MRGASLCATLVLLAALAVPARAEVTADVVSLADGTEIVGLVIQQEPGKFVTIRLPDGSQQTLSWSEIKRVTLAPRASVAPAPPVTTAPPAVAPPAVAPPAVAPAPAGPTTNLSLTPEGASLTMRQESVLVVDQPGNVSFGLHAGYAFSGAAFKNGFFVSPLGVTLGFNLLAGQQFPGADGGVWNGIVIEPTVAYTGGMGQLPATLGGQSGDELLIQIVRYGGFIGWELLSFGPMEKVDDLRLQSGIGLRVGAFLGGAFTWTHLSANGPLSGWKMIISEATSNDFTWAPQVAFLLPSRNEGTSHVRVGTIYASVYPTSDGATVTAGIDVSF